MERTLNQFSAELHQILAADPGPAGRKKVCKVVQEMCRDDGFVKKYLPDNAPERNILYEDPELGFCILAHVYHGAKESKPHDHGPTWAIYGQADGETIMSDWELLSPPNDGQPGKVRLVRNYKLKPGAAYVYNEGDLHSPRREGSTRLIRIEGRNVEKIKRLPYEVA
jgi:predicted metal-dependent enzyme (double-stranded beta helix superfamily)